MTGTNDWNTKEEKIQQDLLWALGPEKMHQTTKSEFRTEPDNIKTDKPLKLCNRYYLPKKTYTNQKEIFWAKQTNTETPEDHWEKLVDL